MSCESISSALQQRKYGACVIEYKHQARNMDRRSICMPEEMMECSQAVICCVSNSAARASTVWQIVVMRDNCASISAINIVILIGSTGFPRE